MQVNNPQKAPQAPCQDISNSSMCLACQSLLVRPEETISEINPALYTFGSIKRSAADGCPICETFYSRLCFYVSEDLCRFSVKINFSSQFNHAKHIPERDGALARAIQLNAMDPHNATKARITLLPSLNLGSQECLSQAAAWMQNCMVNHEKCNANLGTIPTAILPARVIDVGGTTARLVTTADLDTGVLAPYLTVSHRWMARGMPKLLKCNLETMQQNVQLQALPAVFQESVILARAIGICYVWIDSLCIIQDDPSDVQTEISNMGHIYRNAILNVGALKTSWVPEKEECEHIGLFVDRHSQEPPPFQLTIQRTNYKGNYFAHLADVADLVSTSPLMKRGWVLQERLLSRRSIYFGLQAWWECSEQLATTQFPDGLPESAQYGIQYGIETPWRTTTILTPPKYEIYDDMSISHQDQIYKGWASIASFFSRCKVTFEQDYLLALSGIAKEFQAALGENYYAGLWEQDMIRGLLWYRDSFDFDCNGVCTQEYRGTGFH
jgi:hypothetical protein